MAVRRDKTQRDADQYVTDLEKAELEKMYELPSQNKGFTALESVKKLASKPGWTLRPSRR